jgi:hemoglobin
VALYDELGGAEAVSLALDRFYPKVLAHPVVSPYFAGVDMARLKERASPFVAMALGGPNEYKGPGLRAVHSHLLSRGLNDEAFDAFVGLFEDVLKELAVPGDKVSQVVALLNGARGEVLNR